MFKRIFQVRLHAPSVNLLQYPLVVILSILLFLFQYNIGINFSDEGFLWTGTWFTSHGLVPFLDFQSYSPGRYYWTYSIGSIFGLDLLGLRISVFIFQLIGIITALHLIRKFEKNLLVNLVWITIIILWMFPRHKLFEHTLALTGIYFAYLLISRRDNWGYLVAGIATGIAVTFGKNHGLYWVVAMTLTHVFLWLKHQLNTPVLNMFYALLGITIGLSPLIFLDFIHNGFLQAYMEQTLYLFNRGSTNLTLPIPWPWGDIYAENNIIYNAHLFSKGMLLVMLLLVPIAVIAMLLLRKELSEKPTSLLIAATAFSIAYGHYAFSRADVNHLAQGITPFLIVLPVFFYVLFSHNRLALRLSLAVLATLTIASAPVSHPAYAYFSNKASFTETAIKGDTFYVSHKQARIIEKVGEWRSSIMSPDEKVLIAVNMPVFYPVLDIKEPPFHDLYIIFPKSEDYQMKQIDYLQANPVEWVIFREEKYDGRDDLLLQNSNALLYEYIQNNFKQIDSIEDVSLLKKIDASK